MSSELSIIFEQIFKIIYLGLAPLVIAVVLVSILSSVIQSAMSVRNESFDFAFKLMAFLLALYFFLPGVITALIELFRACYNA